MIRMLCRNKVADFRKWKAIFASHRRAHEQAGLTLESLWRGLEDASNVFFVFAVADLGRAKAFISTAEAAQAGREAGVIEGEYWFASEIEDADAPLAQSSSP